MSGYESLRRARLDAFVNADPEPAIPDDHYADTDDLAERTDAGLYDEADVLAHGFESEAERMLTEQVR